MAIVDNYDEDEEDRSKLLLECPHCGDCSTVINWNKSIENFSIPLGAIDQPIPENLSPDEYDDYKYEHGGQVDCPSCGEATLLEDLNAY